ASAGYSAGGSTFRAAGAVHPRDHRGGGDGSTPTPFLLTRSVVQVVDSGHPAVPGRSPPVSLHRLLGSLALNGVEAVDVEHPVEVVVLVLEDAGQPPLRSYFEPLLLQVDSAKDRQF